MNFGQMNHPVIASTSTDSKICRWCPQALVPTDSPSDDLRRCPKFVSSSDVLKSSPPLVSWVMAWPAACIVVVKSIVDEKVVMLCPKNISECQHVERKSSSGSSGSSSSGESLPKRGCSEMSGILQPSGDCRCRSDGVSG